MWGVTMLILGAVLLIIVVVFFVDVLVNSIKDNDRKDIRSAAGAISCIIVGAVLIALNNKITCIMGMILEVAVAVKFILYFRELAKERDTFGKFAIGFFFFLLSAGTTLFIFGVRFKAVEEIITFCQRLLA